MLCAVHAAHPLQSLPKGTCEFDCSLEQNNRAYVPIENCLHKKKGWHATHCCLTICHPLKRVVNIRLCIAHFFVILCLTIILGSEQHGSVPELAVIEL